MKAHIRRKRSITQGRFFLTKKDMASLKRDEAITYSIAKRDGKKIEGVRHGVCSCGGEGCGWATAVVSDGTATLKTPIPKRQYGRSDMFGGKVVL
jgi:hypothetical protein